jgi:hypothetical protein
LDPRLTTWLCKNIIVAKSKEMKTGSTLDRFFEGMLWLRKGCFANDNEGSFNCGGKV